MSGSIGEVVRARGPAELQFSPNTEPGSQQCGAAIFYSVTSTVAGLQGIELGTQLIKQAVVRLKAEFPQLHTFSTLSPIPGYRAWLLRELAVAAREKGDLLMSQEWAGLVATGVTTYTKLLEVVRAGAWHSDPDLCLVLRPALSRLCARYLLQEKRRGLALNSVANFHLRNGAVVWRLNWLGDTSHRGMQDPGTCIQGRGPLLKLLLIKSILDCRLALMMLLFPQNSCGLMVNYRYYLDQLEENSNSYLGRHIVQADPQVVDLLHSS